MVSPPAKNASSDAPKKTKSGSTSRFVEGGKFPVAHCVAEKGGGKKKLTEFNKFMQTEIARLKEEDPDTPHKERYVPLPPPAFVLQSAV